MISPTSTEYIIREYCERGAVLFCSTKMTLSNYFNPSEEKHAAIYFGTGLVSYLLSERLHGLKSDMSDDEHYIIEFNTQGMRCVPLTSFLQRRSSIKIFYCMGSGFPDTAAMALAATYAFDDEHKRYGLGPKSSYCFKTVAKCYEKVGISVDYINLLGVSVVLSQSFTAVPGWLCVYDSSTGKSLLPWNGNYLEWRVDR